MFLKTRLYRIAVCLLAAVLLMGFSGTALAHEDACPCCGSKAQSGHMQEPSSADCCNTPACDHCAFNAEQKPKPLAATNGPNNTYRKHPTQFFTAQAASTIHLFAQWDHLLLNNVPREIQIKIPIYISIQSILC